MDLSKFLHGLWRKPARTPGVNQAALPRPNAQESRVGPRAAAWVEGRWEQAQFLAPATPAYPALQLDYGLYLPPGLADLAGRPLVVMLHGCSQSGAALARGTRMNVLADRYGFAVLYPQQSPKRHGHGCWHWYDLTASAGGGEAYAIGSLVDALVEQHGFDATRVYLAGLSAGAGMATALAVRSPERFAAVAVHSGMVFGAARSVTSALDVMRRGTGGDAAALVRAALPAEGHPGMPALLLHGAQDQVVSPLNLAQLEAQFLVLNGLVDGQGALLPDAQLQATDRQGLVEHVYRRGQQGVVQSCLVPELGHAWSGGDDTVPFHAGIGPDASLAAWTFFQDKQRLLAADPA